MKKITTFVTILVLVSALAVAQMMPGGMMSESMKGGDTPKSSGDRDNQCAQMMTRMSEMMKQISEMKTQMSQMMEAGMMGGMMKSKKEGHREQTEKSK